MKINFREPCLSFPAFLVSFLLFFFSSCSTQKKISRQAREILLSETAIRHGHIGISIYDPATNKYLYEHQADQYFIPASNTKLFTLYAGMKYLDDSLVGIRYAQKRGCTTIYPTGDPTFLHPSFPQQPVMHFLQQQDSIDFCTQYFSDNLGKGWAWEDYMEPFMAQRSEMPVYGNTARIYKTKDSFSIIPGNITLHQPNNLPYSLEHDVAIYRLWNFNEIVLTAVPGNATNDVYEIPFTTGNYDVPGFISDTLHKVIHVVSNPVSDSIDFNDKRLHKIYSQPSDSVFRFMMHRSDNFFAEQTLLMASQEHLGQFLVQEFIDSLLKTDLRDVPQKPRWVDGSGLSRYNLFTPQDFVYILNKMKNEFGLERLKKILPTGGQGTLKNYFISDSAFIYAKSGTLSNNCALSGFLLTKKSKWVIFSVLVNNYMASSTTVRRAVEKFVGFIRDTY